MATTALPDLTSYDAVLFDLDGVLTPTAEVHMHAWQTMFEELFAAWDIEPPYTERDYFDYLDGKKRYDGVASLLRSRDVEVPWGDPSDDPSGRHGLRHRQPQERGVLPRAARRGHRAVSRARSPCSTSSQAAGIPDRGRVELEERRRGAAVRGPPRALPRRDGRRRSPSATTSPPSPRRTSSSRRARMLGVDPARSVAVEDAISGVQSAAAGGFALVDRRRSRRRPG